MIGAAEFTGTQGQLLLTSINDFIQHNCNLNPKDFVTAFEMACARKLHHAGKPLEVDTFGRTLNINLVGKVINSYSQFKKETGTTARTYYRNELERPHAPISDKDALELVLRWTKEDNQVPPYAPMIGAYRELLKQGKVDKVKKQSSGFAANMSSPERLAVERYLKSKVL